MDNKKVITAITILLTLISLKCFSQVKDFSNDNKFSITLSNGGYWNTSNGGLEDLNYNIAIQGEYRINKNISLALNTGFDFEHFGEPGIIIGGNTTPTPTKMVMFELTSGVNYYLPVQKKSNLILTANLGLYNERIIFPKKYNSAEEYINQVDENWNIRFGFNGGLGLESDFYNSLKWNVMAKYHYIFNYERDMKFLYLNIGLKYYF